MNAATRLRRWLSLAAVVASFAIMGACDGGEPEAAPQSPTSTRPGSAQLVLQRAVDARYPDRSASMALIVSPVDVPESVDAGSRVRAVFQTRADSSCQLAIVYEDGTSGPRLPPAIADGTGLVSWSWVMEDNAGVANAHVVCSGGQRGQAEIRVV